MAIKQRNLADLIKRRFRALLVIVCVGSALIPQLNLQAQQHKHDFFENNYALTPGDNKQRRELSTGRTGTRTAGEGLEQPRARIETADKNSSVSILPAATQIKPGEKVDWIGLVVNSADSAHLESVIKQALSTANTLQINIGAVYMIGQGVKIPALKSYIVALGLWGAEIQFLGSPPEIYEDKKLTNSPTWIVSTEKGEILIEGEQSIEKMFNTNGEFVLPKDPVAALNSNQKNAKLDTSQPQAQRSASESAPAGS